MRLSLIPPTSEDSYLPSLSQNNVSVAPYLLASMPSFSLNRLILAAGFDTCGNKVGDGEQEGMIWSAGTGVFKLTYSSVLPSDFINTSPDKAGVFPSFSDMTTFLASYVPFPFSDTISPTSLAAVFDTCGKKGGDED